MSDSWTSTDLAIAPDDPYTDWAAGPAFAELDMETGGACRYMVLQGSARSYVSLSELEQLVAGGAVLDDLAGPLPPDSIAQGAAAAASVQDDGFDDKLKVIVGVIDDGIAFANERFRKGDADGAPSLSRFEWFWWQDGPASDRFPELDIDGTGSPQPLYGREFSRDEINGLLAGHGGASGVDEDALYAEAGLFDLGRAVSNTLWMRGGHGSHVLDVASGFSPGAETQDARKHGLIAVQLPRQVTRDISGKFVRRFIIDGLRYIVARAEAAMARIGRRLPLAVNLSYGIAAGPHDETMEICADIDAIVRDFNAAHPDAPMAVIVAAGNGHLTRQRAQAQLADGASKTFRFNVLPDDRTSSFMEIWLPAATGNGNREYAVTITPPGDAPASGPLTSAQAGKALQWEDGGAVLARASYGEVGGRGCFHIAWQATTSTDGTAPVAPSGQWQVTIAQQGGAPGTVDAWIQRDDSPFGFGQRGRQAYFDDPDYEIHDPVSGRLVEQDNNVSWCRRSGTMSAFACGAETLVIGAAVANAFRTDEPRPADYTTAGEEPHIANPDAAAVSDDSIVHFGVLATATRSGSIAAMNGTSVSAPQVTRRLAAAMAAGTVGSAKTPRDWLNETAGQGLALDPVRAGAGVIIQPSGAKRTPDRVEAG